MTTVRLGMFETNSSSMHSIVINKDIKPMEESEKEYACYSFEDYDYTSSLEGYRSTVYINMTEERPNTNYCRQDGKVVMNSEDKLYMYLALGANSIWNEVYAFNSSSSADPYKFTPLFEEFVADLQRRVFDALDINIVVSAPSVIKKFYKWNDGEPQYELQWIPYVEDSFRMFDDFLKYLKEDDKALYSFIFSPKSFVILGGDEYDTAYELNRIIKNGIDYDSKMFGHIEASADPEED